MQSGMADGGDRGERKMDRKKNCAGLQTWPKWLFVALGMATLSACTTTENAMADLFVSETQLPAEVRSHEALSTEELMVFGDPGVKEFEIARRFEAGRAGFPKSDACALTFFEMSGRTRTVLREDRLAGGAGQPITYLGFPQARAAARRLKEQGVVPATSIAACLSQMDRSA